MKLTGKQLTGQVLKSPLGDLYAVFFGDFLLMLDFLDSEKIKPKIEKIQKEYQQNIQLKSNVNSIELQNQLDEYFLGQRKIFTIKKNPLGTDFQKKVWKILEEISFGEVISYRKQALILGDLKKIRAVAGANAKNPIMILTPCHRVVGSNGDLVGYSAGIERKRKLLELEKSVFSN